MQISLCILEDKWLTLHKFFLPRPDYGVVWEPYSCGIMKLFDGYIFLFIVVFKLFESTLYIQSYALLLDSKVGMGRRKRRKLPAPAVVTSSPVPPPAPWIDLPDDLTANILQRLDPKEIFESAQIVCTTWRRVCKDPATWRVLDLNYRYYDSAHRKFETICRCAVDRSQGQLVELTVTAFGEDRLLNYVADRYILSFAFDSTIYFVLLRNLGCGLWMKNWDSKKENEKKIE